MEINAFLVFVCRKSRHEDVRKHVVAQFEFTELISMISWLWFKKNIQVMRVFFWGKSYSPLWGFFGASQKIRLVLLVIILLYWCYSYSEYSLPGHAEVPCLCYFATLQAEWI